MREGPPGLPESTHLEGPSCPGGGGAESLDTEAAGGLPAQQEPGQLLPGSPGAQASRSRGETLRSGGSSASELGEHPQLHPTVASLLSPRLWWAPLPLAQHRAAACAGRLGLVDYGVVESS